MNRELWPIVAGGASRGLGIDQLPISIEERRFLRLDADGGQRRDKTELVELADRMRQHVDADAEGQDLGRRFANRAADAGLMQTQRKGQAADAGADDQDFGRRAAFAGSGVALSIIRGSLSNLRSGRCAST